MLESLQAFYSTIVKGTPRPQFSWTFERDGSIKVVAKDRPDEVLVWQAVKILRRATSATTSSAPPIAAHR